MRIYLLYFLCCFGMTSCVYYGDIHPHSREFDQSYLSTARIYKFNFGTKPITPPHWWIIFNDAQLNQLIHVALNDAPTVQIAESRVRRAQHLVEEASSSLWPSLTFDGYVERQRFSEFGLVPPPFNGKIFNIGTLALNFDYEFDFWGKNRQLRLARMNEAWAAQAELAQARLVISAAVATTYFQLLGINEQLKIAKIRWQLYQQWLRIILNRAAHGIYSGIPVEIIRANLQASKLSLEQYRQIALLTRHQLIVLLGKNPFTTEIDLPSFRFHSYQITLPASLPANLLARRPDIYAVKWHAQAAASNVGVAKAKFFPNINLRALFSYQSVGLQHLFNTQSQDNAVTGAIDLPLFDAGARRANLGVKYAEYDLTVNEYNKTILHALGEVADQLSILQTLTSQLKTKNTELHATEHNYKLYRTRYNHGIADEVDLLKNRQRVLQQQAAQIAFQVGYLQAVIGLLKALGGNDMAEDIVNDRIKHTSIRSTLII